LERLSDGGKRAVVTIAGNHDSPDRLHAANPLALKHGISLIGYPKEQLTHGEAGGGVRRVDTGSGWVELEIPGSDAPAIIYAVPYPSESRLNEVLTEDLDDASQQIAYSERVGRLFAEGDQIFRPNAVNLVVAHLFALGGIESESERQLGGALAVSPLAFPAQAQYVALGHLHRPQPVHNTPQVCRYSGSPLSYSFSEADQQKEVVIVDISPGSVAQTRSISLRCGKPLKRWRAGSLEEARNWCIEPKNLESWVDLEIQANQPLSTTELAELRKMHSGIITIRTILPEIAEAMQERRLSEMSLVEKFSLFVQRERGAAPPDDLAGFFLELVNEPEAMANQEDMPQPAGGEVA